MVFGVTEEITRSDQQQQSAYAKGRQRKSSSNNRKGKITLSNLTPRAKARIQSADHLDYHVDSTGTTEYPGNCSQLMSQHDMGNKILSQSCDDGKIMDNNLITNSSAESAVNYSNMDGLVDSSANKEVAATSTIIVQEKPLQSHILVETDATNSEICKLKSLLLLQVSLIGRQQDLLRLRDREIMQLKASNTNYKCQLNRVRRRMSKKKGDGNEESTPPKASTKRKFTENSVDSPSPSQGTATRVGDIDSKTFQSQLLSSNSEHRDSKLLQKSRRHTMDETRNHSDMTSNFNSESNSDKKTVYRKYSDNSLMPTNDKSAILVPLEFVEQKQAELMEAMMISPPEKAIRTFCDITNSSPPLDEFPFKICNRCPHCVAIATEITRLFKNAEQFSSPDPAETTVIDKSQNLEILRMAAVCDPSLNIKECVSKDLTKYTSIMRTSVSYFRVSPTFNMHHWWWDLKCGNIKTGNALKIPTWKENELMSLPSPCDDQDILEVTDDQTFTRRHSKHELDEKRRKRWDIQRIREYRYNEKLRQKLMKQGAMYEAPVLETFSGHLHDAESVEVHESLPVNVFGYPAPHLEPEEFSLPYFDDSIKATSSGRRKVRKI